MNKIKVGDIVFSNKGRDIGTFYIVINELTDNYYVLVNGDNRRFENPKKKLKKHLYKTSKTMDSVKNKLENNVKVFDSEIYSAIKKYKEEISQQTSSRRTNLYGKEG